MTAGLNSRPKEWSRPPEPHPPDAGYWCSRRKRRPYVSLIWCSTPSGHGNGLKPWIRNNDRRAAHEPVNLPLDCKHAHVSGHSEAAIDKISSILLQHHDIVLLPQIPYDVVDNRGRRRLLLGFKGVPGVRASSRDLAGAAHPEPLNLLWGQAELERQLGVLGPFGKARKQSIALILP